MDDEDGVTANIGDLEPLVKVAGMIGKTVRVGRRPARFSHSDQIRRQTATEITDVGDDIPPQVR